MATTVPPAAPSVGSDPASPEVAPAAERGTRGRKPSKLLGLRHPIPRTYRWLFGAVGVAAIFALWGWAASRGGSSSVLVPTPAATWRALWNLWFEGTLRTDLWASTRRVAIGYSISVAIGVVLGILMGSFFAIGAGLDPTIAFARYVPPTALTPLFLLWLGIDEAPKIWLIVVGTVFYNILMVGDVARNVPRELIDASAALGADRRTILRRVIFPHALPGMIDVTRINLAAAWLMLVVAEILAAQSGLAYQINQAQRFRAVDTMFALLLVFGFIGLVSDLALRGLRNVVAPWARP